MKKSWNKVFFGFLFCFGAVFAQEESVPSKKETTLLLKDLKRMTFFLFTTDSLDFLKKPVMEKAFEIFQKHSCLRNFNSQEQSRQEKVLLPTECDLTILPVQADNRQIFMYFLDLKVKTLGDIFLSQERGFVTVWEKQSFAYTESEVLEKSEKLLEKLLSDYAAQNQQEYPSIHWLMWKLSSDQNGLLK